MTRPRYSKQKSKGSMDDDTLKKLRESTFPSPEEENTKVEQIKNKRQVIPKVHLELKKSSDGGWVPQDITISRSGTFGHEKKKPTNMEKRFSFSGLFFKSKTKVKDIGKNSDEEGTFPGKLGEQHRKSCIDLYGQETHEDVIKTGPTRKSCIELHFQGSSSTVPQSNVDANKLFVPQIQPHFVPQTKNNSGDLKVIVPPQINTKTVSLQRNKAPTKMTKPTSCKLSKETAPTRSLSCPDLVQATSMCKFDIFTTTRSLARGNDNHPEALPSSCAQFDEKYALDKSSGNKFCSRRLFTASFSSWLGG